MAFCFTTSVNILEAYSSGSIVISSIQAYVTMRFLTQKFHTFNSKVWNFQPLNRVVM